MPRNTIPTAIRAAVVTAGVAVLPAVGNATYLVLNDGEMDQITAGYNIQGAWTAPDGGTYYIRQVNIGGITRLYWYGESGGYANVASGQALHAGDTSATERVQFAGVPHNNDSLGAGTLILTIGDDGNSLTVQTDGTSASVGPLFGSTGSFQRCTICR